jgi:DNA primase
MSRLGTKLRDYDDHVQRPSKRKGKTREWLHRVDVVDFLEGVQVENIKQATSDEINFSCPFPGHSSGDLGKPSAYMNDGTKDESKATVWKCHGCGRAGNAISFLAEMENIGPSEAASELRERYAPDYRAPRGGIGQEFEERLRKANQPEEDHSEHVITDDVYDKRFGVDWDDAWEIYQGDDCPPEVAYLFDRGFEPATLTEWNIGYDERGERITIPICNVAGEIIGVKARAWKKKVKPKYLIYGDKEGKPRRYGWPHYEKSRVLFGLDKCGDADKIVLVEGELDVIALWQIGIPAIATGGAALSEIQSILLRDKADEVIVFYDSDNAGWEATVEVVVQLQPFVRVKVVPDHDSDASKMVEQGKVEELRTLIASGVSSYRLLLD